MDDLMRAKDILSAIKRHKERIAPADEDGGVIAGYRLAHDQITEIIRRCIPTVWDVKPVVRAKWGKDGDCPVCGCQPWYERDIHTLNFCPSCGADMREVEHYCPHDGEGCSADDDCEACWSQEYQEEPEPKQKKFDASVVFVVLAVLEALWSIIAVVQGDSERLRFCCVMGLLYVIAAGVWRTNQ